MTTPEPADRGPEPPDGNDPEPPDGHDPEPPDGHDPEPPDETGRLVPEDQSEPNHPAPADWSTPATVADTPPLGGPLPERAIGPGPSDPVVVVPPPRSGRRDPRPWVVLAVAAAFLLCCYAMVGLAIAAWADDVVEAVRSRTQRAVGIDQPVRDGAIEFRVRQMRCGVPRIGDSLISQAATGQYCVVEVEVRNLGSGPVILTDTLHEAYGPHGERYVADPGAGLLANADDPAFLTEINPGNQVRGTVVYDIPPTSRIVRLRLHESAGSRGALVRV